MVGRRRAAGQGGPSAALGYNRRMPSARWVSTVLVLLAAAGVGCDDYEQQAMRAGHEAHARVAGECNTATGEAFATCMREVCLEGCTSLGDAARFRGACMTACTEAGVCTTDEDCRAPEVCVTIAPRVRRCGASAGAGR